MTQENLLKEVATLLEHYAVAASGDGSASAELAVGYHDQILDLVRQEIQLRDWKLAHFKQIGSSIKAGIEMWRRLQEDE